MGFAFQGNKAFPQRFASPGDFARNPGLCLWMPPTWAWADTSVLFTNLPLTLQPPPYLPQAPPSAFPLRGRAHRCLIWRPPLIPLSLLHNYSPASPRLNDATQWVALKDVMFLWMIGLDFVYACQCAHCVPLCMLCASVCTVCPLEAQSWH